MYEIWRRVAATAQVQEGRWRMNYFSTGRTVHFLWSGKKKTKDNRGDAERNFRENEYTKTNITIGTLNLLDGRGNRLELACKELSNHGVDICITTEIKLKGFHTVKSYGYSITATKCKNVWQWGVAIIYRKGGNWHIEGKRSFGQNVIRADLIHGAKRTIILGVYIPSSEDDSTTLKFINKALHNVETDNVVILGDLNINFDQPTKSRDIEITEGLRSFNVKNLSNMFKARRRKWFSWTWRKFRQGSRMQAVCDYILTGRGIKWGKLGPWIRSMTRTTA